MKIIYSTLLVVVLLGIGAVVFKTISNSSLENQTSAEVTTKSKNNQYVGDGVLVCHKVQKQPLSQHYSVDSARTLPLLESLAVAMKGVSSAAKTEPRTMQTALGLVSGMVMTLPGVASTQLIHASCSVLGANGEVMCEDGVAETLFAVKQETKIRAGIYTRVVDLKSGGQILAEGKIGDPGKESLVYDAATGLHAEFTENADCSGTLTSSDKEGTVITAQWQYLGNDSTSGSFSVTSPDPIKNINLSW